MNRLDMLAEVSKIEDQIAAGKINAHAVFTRMRYMLRQALEGRAPSAEAKDDEHTAAALLSKIRWACGDNGKRMQPELVEFIGTMAKEAERYRFLRRRHVREWVSDMPENKGKPSLDIDFEAPGHDLDAAIDAAIAQQEASQ